VTGYGLLAMRHPDRRWRLGTAVVALLVAGVLYRASAAGLHVSLPVADLAPVVARLSLAQAQNSGALDGQWKRAEGGGDDLWLVSRSGAIRIGPGIRRVDQLRMVIHPVAKGRHRTCPELLVQLNGVRLGDRLLHIGRRAYVFRVGDVWHPEGPNLVVLDVRPGSHGGQPPLAFHEVTLHAGG